MERSLTIWQLNLGSSAFFLLCGCRQSGLAVQSAEACSQPLSREIRVLPIHIRRRSPLRHPSAPADPEAVAPEVLAPVPVVQAVAVGGTAVGTGVGGTGVAVGVGCGVGVATASACMEIDHLPSAVTNRPCTPGSAPCAAPALTPSRFVPLNEPVSLARVSTRVPSVCTRSTTKVLVPSCTRVKSTRPAWSSIGPATSSPEPRSEIGARSPEVQSGWLISISHAPDASTLSECGPGAGPLTESPLTPAPTTPEYLPDASTRSCSDRPR